MIRIMQVGYGYWGANVMRKLTMSEAFRFLYLAESDEGRRKAAEKILPAGTTAVADYKAFLDEVDAVAICTQTAYSFQIAMDAMEAGKHVFIEKPVAQSVEKAVVLADKAKKKGVVLHCDHLMVYNHVVRYIKGMIDRGEVGDIMYIDITRVNLGPIRKDINAMLDLAVHDIAVVDYLLDGAIPERLSAYGAKHFGKQETLTYLTMKCGNTLVNINSSWISPVKMRKTVIGGTKKMLIFDDIEQDKLTIYDSGIDVVQGTEYGEYEFKTRTGDIYKPHLEFEDALRNSLEYFADCVETGKKSLSGPEESLRVMQILERAHNALEHGGKARKDDF